MSIRNPRDFWSGVLFVTLGIATIVLSSKYTLGSAARMGPGYFPRILGILLIVLGGILALRATAKCVVLRCRGGNGGRSSSCSAASCCSARSCTHVGVALSTVLLIVDGERCKPRIPPAGIADRRRAAGRPCGWRLRHRPAAAVADLALAALGATEWNFFSHLAVGFGVALTPDQPAVRADRYAARHADRRVAWHRSGGDDRDAAADDLRAAARVGADHARRHLLRRAIRRLDDGDPAQHARRIVVGGHVPRRLPDGAQGPGRRRAGDCSARVVLCRDVRDGACRSSFAAVVGGRSQVRPGRILLADGAGADRRSGARARLAV